MDFIELWNEIKTKVTQYTSKRRERVGGRREKWLGGGEKTRSNTHNRFNWVNKLFRLARNPSTKAESYGTHRKWFFSRIHTFHTLIEIAVKTISNLLCDFYLFVFSMLLFCFFLLPLPLSASVPFLRAFIRNAFYPTQRIHSLPLSGSTDGYGFLVCALHLYIHIYTYGV